jgi:hypothetical protein
MKIKKFINKIFFFISFIKLKIKKIIKDDENIVILLYSILY